MKNAFKCGPSLNNFCIFVEKLFSDFFQNLMRKFPAYPTRTTTAATAI